MPSELCFDRSALDSPEAAKTFERSGCLQIANFLPTAKIATLAEAVEGLLTNPASKSQAIRVGANRHMISVPVKGVFNDSDLFAPQELNEFFSLVLGEHFLLSCFTCIVAKPGAPDQHLHQDFAGLFGNPVDSFAPSFAINLFIPLVALNAVHGTTRIWPYSHRKIDRGAGASDSDCVEPHLEPGSALLLDYRVLHGGTANLSSQSRPLLCLAYSRDWFLDTRNFQEIDPLQVEANLLEEMEPHHRRLFKRAELYHKTGPQ